jgi:hypothetical protein
LSGERCATLIGRLFSCNVTGEDVRYIVPSIAQALNDPDPSLSQQQAPLSSVAHHHGVV